MSNTVPQIPTLKIDIKAPYAYVTLNRPDKRNSLDPELIAAITQAFTALNEHKDVRVIILSGAGGHFCSGLYLNYLEEISKYGPLENLKDSESFLRLLLSIYRCSKPVIAKVQGYALAGGCGIASACDVIVADTTATFGYTEVRFGFVPAIVAAFLVRRIGESRAKDILLTGRFFKADEAEKIGFANRLTTPENLDTAVLETAEALTKVSGSSVALTKGMFEHIGEMSLEAALNYAKDLNALARQTDDFKSGIAKFLEKK